MRERLNLISKLLTSKSTRAAYIKAKLGVLVPSQIRALRLKSEMSKQSDLAKEARSLKLHQSRISMFETPGAANMTLETLAKMAALFKVGLVIKFVPFSEMLRWENSFSQDDFNVTKVDEDQAFLNPTAKETIGAAYVVRRSYKFLYHSTLVLTGDHIAGHDYPMVAATAEQPFPHWSAPWSGSNEIKPSIPA